MLNPNLPALHFLWGLHISVLIHQGNSKDNAKQKAFWNQLFLCKWLCGVQLYRYVYNQRNNLAIAQVTVRNSHIKQTKQEQGQ